MKKNDTRLDTLVVARGLVSSRERARALILAGQVRVNGAVVSKAGTPVDAGAEVTLIEPDHPYVGRGGVKLAHALDTFAIDVTGRLALDVGHGQIDWTLRNDPRVLVFEHFNARRLQPSDLPAPVDLVTIDVSFISLRQILPVVPPLLRSGADVIALVKPQFEAGRAEIRKGVIRDATVQSRVVEEVSAAAREVGLTPVASTPSPITGAKGNVEFLLHLRP